jgi:hypothetical protein
MQNGCRVSCFYSVEASCMSCFYSVEAFDADELVLECGGFKLCIWVGALDHFSTRGVEEYVTSSVLGQGVFDSPLLTLVIGANIF